jgi:hypothetical protein
MRPSPVVIHISGSPGSGKTTLGEELLLLYGKDAIAVRDTDDCAETAEFKAIDPNDHAQLKLVWLRLVDECVREFLAQNADKMAVIFVGILSITFGRQKKEDVFYTFPPGTRLYFLQVDKAQLLRQFYSRIIDHGRRDPALWEEMAYGKGYIHSSSEKLSEIEKDEREHVTHGYEFLSKAAIESKIGQLACFRCKSAVAQVQCVACGIRLCGEQSCTHDGHACKIKASIKLRYFKGNYISGTKIDFTVWKESQILYDNLLGKAAQLSDYAIERIFSMADKEQGFHKRTADDHAKCCDIPYEVIEYGSDKVVAIEDAPLFASELFSLFQTSFVQEIHQTRMRIPSSMK